MHGIYFFSANVLRTVFFFSVVADFVFVLVAVVRVFGALVAFGASAEASAGAVSVVFFVVFLTAVRRWGFLAGASGASGCSTAGWSAFSAATGASVAFLLVRLAVVRRWGFLAGEAASGCGEAEAGDSVTVPDGEPSGTVALADLEVAAVGSEVAAAGSGVAAGSEGSS